MVGSEAKRRRTCSYEACRPPSAAVPSRCCWWTPGGDHTVLLARVTEAEPGEDSLRSLTWYQRSFGAHTSPAQ